MSRVLGVPALLWASVVAGLVVALLRRGAWDLVALFLVASPLIVAVVAARRPR